MSKIYAIKLNNGNLHKNNLGEIVYFSNKYNAKDYMKYNHYDGVIQPLHIDLEKDNKIADLEAKLAESEKLTERLQQIVDKLRDKEFAGKTLVEAVNGVYEPLYKNKYDEAEELKQQLAEKEEEIKNLVLSHFESETNKSVLTTTQMINQVKISFAVEQLEKVKEYLKHKGFVLKVKAPIELPSIKNQEYLNQFNIFVEDFDRIFDNQIKQLKEKK